MSRNPQVGESFGPYTITAHLGRGRSSTVYRATQQDPDVDVALKVVPTYGPDFVAGLNRTSDLLAKAADPHLLKVLAVGEQDGSAYVALPLVLGGDLGTRLAADGPLLADQALIVTEQIASALVAAHDVGLVHGDLAPTKVLLDEHDGQPNAYLTGFGGQRPDTDPGSRSGYEAPERLAGGPATAAADLYSLGCVFVAAMTGRGPYQGTEDEVTQHHLTSPIPQWEESGPLLVRLNALVRGALAKDPADRYPSVQTFRDEAREALADLGVAAPLAAAEAPPEADPGARGRSRKALISSVAALALVIAAVIGVTLLTKDDEPRAVGKQTEVAATPSPTPSPILGPRTCQEGFREVAAGERCGEPYGLPGLRFVFADISSDCVGKRLNTDRFWQYRCEVDGAEITYSTFKTNALASQHNEDAYDGPRSVLPSGLVQYGPEQRANGSYSVSVTYDGVHPYGAEVSAATSERAQQIADDLSIRAPETFRGD